jgi:hypothetical protein
MPEEQMIKEKIKEDKKSQTSRIFNARKVYNNI